MSSYAILRFVPQPALRERVVRRYATAVFISLGIILLRWLLGQVIDDGMPFATLFLAIGLSAYYGGLGPGIVSVLITMSLADYLLIPPLYTFGLPDAKSVVGTLLFSISGLVISALGEAGRKAVQRASGEAEIRKAAQGLLAANEERLGIVEGVVAGGVWDWDIANDQVYWSDSYRRLMDYPLDELPSQAKWLASVYSGDRDRVVHRVEELFRERLHNCALQYRIRTATGRIRWIDAHAQIFYDERGKPERMVGINLDITARRAADEAVRDNEARMRLILRYARIGEWEWNPTERTTKWSEELYDVLGIARTEPATFENWLSHVVTADRERMRVLLDQLIQGSDNEFHFEYRALGSDGVERLIHERGVIVRDPEGRSIRMVGISIDVSRGGPSARPS